MAGIGFFSYTCVVGIAVFVSAYALPMIFPPTTAACQSTSVSKLSSKVVSYLPSTLRQSTNFQLHIYLGQNTATDHKKTCPCNKRQALFDIRAAQASYLGTDMSAKGADLERATALHCTAPSDPARVSRRAEILATSTSDIDDGFFKVAGDAYACGGRCLGR